MDIGSRLRNSIRKLMGKPYVDESELKSVLKELQRTLIASDVDVSLVLDLTKRIEKKAISSEKLKGLTLKQHIIKTIYDELVSFMGESYSPEIKAKKILMVGLYGSGKTTTSGKLAKYYHDRGLSVLLVGADCDRPAAKEQLEGLAKKAGVSFFTIMDESDPETIVKKALESAKEDVVIVDSSGRSALDQDLAEELKGIHSALSPDETYLVVSADIGQVAGKQAEAFASVVPITGVIVTKMEGSGRGGGALSSVARANAKIAFIGVGEKLGDLRTYSSESFVSRLLGMVDIKGLLERVKELEAEGSKAELSGEFNLRTFYEQMKATRRMGPIGEIMSMVGLSDVPKEVRRQGEKKMQMFEAFINSMTEYEREHPEEVRKSKSRMERIAKGAGADPKDLKEFLDMFEKMRKMVKKFHRDRGFRKKMEGMLKNFNLPFK